MTTMSASLINYFYYNSNTTSTTTGASFFCINSGCGYVSQIMFKERTSPSLCFLRKRKPETPSWTWRNHNQLQIPGTATGSNYKYISQLLTNINHTGKKILTLTLRETLTHHHKTEGDGLWVHHR